MWNCAFSQYVCLKQPGCVWVPECQGLRLQVQQGQGWERCCCYLCRVGVPGLSCHGDKFPSWELWKGSLPLAHPPLCVGHWECWLHSAPRHSLKMPHLSIIAHFWESRTCFSQSHEPDCWKVGIVPLIAPKRKREGRWLQCIIVDFVLKNISFFVVAGAGTVL